MAWFPRRSKPAPEVVSVPDDAFRKAVNVAVATIHGEDFARKAAIAPTSAKAPGSSWSNQGTINTALIARLTQNLASEFGRAPEDVENALAEAGESWGPPFPPGRPLDPFWGYRRPPRTLDFSVGENVQITPRWNRISFPTLKAIIDSYYAAQIAVRHLINDVRSLDYQFVPPQNVMEDASDDLAIAEAFFVSPDHRQPFRAWLAEYLQDVLRYDAGTLYIRRDEAGRPMSLEVVSGPTIIPLIDFFGREPMDEMTEEVRARIEEMGGLWDGNTTPAFLQIIQGMPWVWLTADDIIYQRLNPLPESQYGLAPMEAVLLQANTDIRFQWFFLQHFTEGTIPAGFMEAPPDLSDPQQIAEWQAIWDGIMLGDQAKLNQIRWVPAGAKFTQLKDQAFDSSFSLYLMRCTAAAFGVTPNDLGFTEDVNRSTGEIQVDVQFRVGTLPVVRHVEDVINTFIHQHLKLKARIQFDTGQGTQHRLETAQANKLLVDMGAISTDEVRMSLGKRISRERPTPRYVNNTRTGPISLLAIEAVSGKTDPTTYGPAKGQKAIPGPFVSPPGALPTKGSPDSQAAAQGEMNLQAKLKGDPPPKPPTPPAGPRPPRSPRPSAGPSQKEADPRGGISVGTGVQGVDFVGEDEDDQDALLKVAEMVKSIRQWRENALNRVKKGQPPRKFEDLPPFVSDAIWSRLHAARTRDEVIAAFSGDILAKSGPKVENDLGRGAAGIVVQALDTGRVLMVQRLPDKHDPDEAYARWEFPGGKLDGGPHQTEPDKSVWEGAIREWSEETGATLPEGIEPVGGWVSDDKFYEGFVVHIPEEADLDLNVQPEEVSNAKWWAPEELDDPVIRDKVTEVLGLIHPVLKAKWTDFHHHTDKIVGEFAPQIKDAMSQVLQADSVRHVIQSAYQATKAKNLPPAGPVPPAAVPPAVAGGVAAVGAGVGATAGIAAGTASAIGATGILAALLALARNLGPLKAAIQRLYAEAFLQGSHEAAQASGGVMIPSLESLEIPPTFWDTWSAAQTDRIANHVLANPPQSLAMLLADLDVVIQGISTTEVNRIHEAIIEAMKNPVDMAELGAVVAEITNDEKRAWLIAETEYARALTLAARETYRINNVQKVAWLHQPGACGRCMENADVSPIAITDSWPSGSSPVHPLCLPGTARVVVPQNEPSEFTTNGPLNTASVFVDGSGRTKTTTTQSLRDLSRIRAASDRHFVGDLVTIQTASGHELSATPNHPIATPLGWIPISELKVGDNVLCSTSLEWGSDSIYPDVDNVPPTIEEIAQALPVTLRGMPLSPEDFHGDASSGDVYVIHTHGFLGDNIQTTLDQHINQDSLGKGSSDGALLDGAGTAHLRVVRERSASDSGVSSFSEPSAFLGGGLTHAENHSLGTVAWRDTIRQEDSTEGAAADTEGFCERLLAFSPNISSEEVVKVGRYPFSGHVYNLDVVDGWYISNAIVTHNCRCAEAPAVTIRRKPILP